MGFSCEDKTRFGPQLSAEKLTFFVCVEALELLESTGGRFNVVIVPAASATDTVQTKATIFTTALAAFAD